MTDERETGSDLPRLLERVLVVQSAFLSEELTSQRAIELGHDLVLAKHRYYKAEADRDPEIPLHDAVQRLEETVARSERGDFAGLKEFLRNEATDLFVYPLSGTPSNEAIQLAQRLRQAANIIPDR